MAYYYVDYTNGSDSRTGLRIPAGDHDSVSYYTIDSTADTTHFVDSALTGANDYINGGYVYNVTRSIGAVVSDFDAATDTVTLATAIAGMTAGDSYYILNSFKNISQFTTAGSARSPGDKCYVRANQTHNLASTSLGFDEDGSVSAFIYLIGCNATQGVDPYHDGSDVRPTLDFGATTAYVQISGDYWWYIQNLDVRGSTSSNGNISLTAAIGTVIDNCMSRDGGASTTGIRTSMTRGIWLMNCVVEKCPYYGMYLMESYVVVTRCVIDANASGSSYGIATRGSEVIVNNCIIGASTPFLTDIHFSYSHVLVGNSTLSSSVKLVTLPDYVFGTGSTEDYLGVYGSFYRKVSCLGVTNSTAVTRPGGASSTVVMQPYITMWYKSPISINNSIINPDFRVWSSANERTITVYIRGFNWASFPTAEQLYIKAEYISAASPLTYSSAVSTQVLTDNTTWVAFRVTVTPVVASFFNIWVQLGQFEDTSTGIYVDPKLVVS
jgi:hypothetical protein